MYAAAKGISRSKLVALLPALFFGTNIKPIITKTGVGTKISRGKNWYNKARVNAIAETGRVSIATKNINET
jgi:hypothetical protein